MLQLLMMKDISAPMSSSSSSVSSGRKIKLKKPSMKSAGGPRKPPFKK